MGKKGDDVCRSCNKLTPEGSEPDIQVGINIKEIEAGFAKMREHLEDLEHAKDGIVVAGLLEKLWGQPVYPKRLVDSYEENAKKSTEAINAYRRQLLHAIEIVKLACRSRGHDHDREAAEKTRFEKDLAAAVRQNHGYSFPIPIIIHEDCRDHRIYTAWQAWLADIDAKVMAESIGEAAIRARVEDVLAKPYKAPPATDVEQEPVAAPETPGLTIKPLLKDIDGPHF